MTPNDERAQREKEYAAWYRATHKEQIKEYHRVYYQNHKEIHRAHRDTWVAKNPERAKEISRAYRLRNAELQKSRVNHWNARHPDALRALWRKRRLRKAHATDSHTLAEWLALKALYGYKCLACGRAETERKLTRDHVRPLVKGGTDDISNIQSLCQPCNSTKHDRIIDYRPPTP